MAATDPNVRTHSTRVVQSTGLETRLSWLQCRGCGERWPTDADRTAIEQEPCGTR